MTILEIALLFVAGILVGNFGLVETLRWIRKRNFRNMDDGLRGRPE